MKIADIKKEKTDQYSGLCPCCLLHNAFVKLYCFPMNGGTIVQLVVSHGILIYIHKLMHLNESATENVFFLCFLQ